MSAIWILYLKPLGNGKQKSRPVLKLIGLQKLWTNDVRLSHLLMKKWVGNHISDSQPSLLLMKKTYLTYKLSQLPNFVRV